MEKILRIDLTKKTATCEDLPEAYRYLGGRGLSSRIVLDEVPPRCDPLGKHNKLVYTCGLVAGTTASSSNRISIGAKSPLTGGIKESSGGGLTALNLARLGFRAMIFEGVSEDPVMVYIDETGAVTFLDAAPILGKRTYDAMDILLGQYPKGTAFSFIGPAGEMLMNVAGIANTDMEGHPTRYSARGGLGAVMGSKKLKAVIIGARKGGPAYVQDMELWKTGTKLYSKAIQTARPTSYVMPNFGTPLTMEQMNGMGAALVEGFRRGQVNDITKCGGEAYRKAILERGGCGSTTHACMPGCMVRCSSIFPNKDGSFCNTPLEYENMGLLGTNLCLEDLDQMNILNHMCNQYGVDTIETGAALSVLAEAGIVKYGDFDGFVKLLEEVEKGSPMGRLIGLGAAGCAKAFGVTRTVAPKGQTIAAYDPRTAKINGVTYITSPMGGDHTAGNGIFIQADHTDPKGKVQLSYECQVVSGWVDSLGICTFCRTAHFVDPNGLLSMLKARYGGEWDKDRLDATGRETPRTEITFNRKAGIPDVAEYEDFVKEEPLPPMNVGWEIDEEELRNIWKPLFDEVEDRAAPAGQRS